MDSPTLAGHIRAGAAAHDGCPLVFAAADGERATTLGALVSDAEKAAGALQARGIGRGDVVAVQLPGSYEGAVIQAAVGLCGAVLLPVVMIYGPREMDFVLRRSGAAAVVLPREHRGRPHADVVLRGLSGLPALKFAVVDGRQTPRPRCGRLRPDCSPSRAARTASRALTPATARCSCTPRAPRPSPRACSTRTGPCWPRRPPGCTRSTAPAPGTWGSSRPVTWPGCSACCGSCCSARPR